MIRVHDLGAMTWNAFKALFEVKYVTIAAWAAKKKEFTNLEQGDMYVDEYGTKLEELSRYAPYLVSTEELKVKQFVDGLRAS